jgi:hypothetical protein
MDSRGGSTRGVAVPLGRGTADDAKIAAIDFLDARLLDGSEAMNRDPGAVPVASRQGYSAQLQPETLPRFAFATGAEWAIGKE